jgi:methyl coenzyme M reductase alpha subunit
MTGQRLARVSLLIDAVFCATVGIVLIALRKRLGQTLRLPGLIVAAIGAGAAGWSAVVLAQALRGDWRTAAGQVALANVAGAAALIVVAAFHPARGARVLLATTAAEVFGFAVALGLSLLRLRPWRQSA